MLKKIFAIIGLLAFTGFANAESRLQQIQESGKLRVGTTGRLEPYVNERR
jgi:VIT1/CCC1 family predicted Fe2+/Mn2+ transporter